MVLQIGSSINFGKRLHRSTIRGERWKKADQGPFHQVCDSSLHCFRSWKGQKILHLSQRQGRDLHDWRGWTTDRVEGEGGCKKYLRNTEDDPWKNKEEREFGGILIRKGRVMLISIYSNYIHLYQVGTHSSSGKKTDREVAWLMGGSIYPRTAKEISSWQTATIILPDSPILILSW